MTERFIPPAQQQKKTVPAKASIKAYAISTTKETNTTNTRSATTKKAKAARAARAKTNEVINKFIVKIWVSIQRKN